MNNSRLVILLIIVFIVGVTSVYWIYQSQVSKSSEELLPVPSPLGEVQISPTPQPSPKAQSIADRIGSLVPSVQPEAGSETQAVNNIGITVNSPNAGIQISSPLTVSGFANVFEGKVVVKVVDGNGKVLGENQTTACMDYDACHFETTVNFTPSTTQAGTISVYNPSGVDGSPNHLQTLLVRF